MAIRHIVLWKVGVDDKELRERAIEMVSQRLEALVGIVEGLTSICVSANSIPVEGNWDMALVAEFENEEALGAYAVHPKHLEIAKEIRKLATARAAVDILI